MRNPRAGMYSVANSKFSPGAGEPGEAVWGSPHGETMDYEYGVMDLEPWTRAKWEVELDRK